ncbi:MAG TPA: 2'-5' RNA ligase family protein [Terriglobia bacterium]|nr:2'-5' RNA ligase family protein [Terriglobia bacterium]
MPFDENPAAKGYAVWLMPAEPAFSLLAGAISRLSREHSTPRFKPHITLLGRIVLREEKALAKAALLARVLKPFRFELGNIGFLDDYFRSIFLTVVGDHSVSSAYRAACGIFYRQNAPYLPHISLIYGKLPVKTKQRVATGFSSLLDRTFQVHQLMLTRVDGRVRQWKRIKAFDL